MSRRPAARAARRWSIAAAMAAMAMADPALAQTGGDGFLFRAPRATLTLRVGHAGTSGRGDLLGFATDTLTLGRGDLGGISYAADLAFGRAGSRFDFVLGAGYVGSDAPSEFRNWVDLDDQPIEQRTSFRRVPLSASVRTYLTPRGRSVGRFAWVPARVTPYVGAGAGLIWYEFEQEGSFVDFDTNAIFEDTFTSSGWGPLGQGMAGLDVSLTPRVGLTADARYVYARAKVVGDFVGFDAIDLSGFATSVGFTFRF